MTKLRVGARVQVISAIPGFHLQKGVIASITVPFVTGEQREEALRELRLYVVELEDGRHFSFRGKELQFQEEEQTGSHVLAFHHDAHR
jgi:hypothetical protein